MKTHNPHYARSDFYTHLAKMSFDKIFDLTAGVCFNNFDNFLYQFINITVNNIGKNIDFV